MEPSLKCPKKLKYQTKKYPRKFSQKSIVKKIQIVSKSQKLIFLQIICPVTQKQRLKSKKVQE